ncbi:MAG TPA: 2-oxo-4-hydroxy-4-carboxy-5-ureidoimidazoline decarboxylase [Gemmatimonadaceae bacterium]
MTTSLAELNTASADRAAEWMRACCGASRWVSAIVARRPFANEHALLDAADEEWSKLGPSDWLEAFAHHPRIGGKKAAEKQGERAAGWSAGEQARVSNAGVTVQQQLAEVNRAYEARFGHIYIVCAAGKSADELLAIAHERMLNDPERELRVAADEQRKITRLRLQKLLNDSP